MDMVGSLNKVFDGFKIDAKCIGAIKHRHFSFYDVELDPGCRISKIVRYSREISIAMRVSTDFIVKPIPEKGIIRLQTTNSAADVLHFETLYKRSLEKNGEPKGTLPLLIGETDEGKAMWVDMAKCPHLLVAGSTGSGKSVFLHNLIANVSKRKDTKLFLVDTKKVEFGAYSKDLSFKRLISYCATDYNSAYAMLRYLYGTMETRYNILCDAGLNSIEENPNIFQKYLIVIDEASDLLLQRPDKEFETLLTRLAQMARAAGIYIVLATQRPSADVLTGLIKANFPARLACKVTSKINSRVVLDCHGAESLAGRGDAIFKNSVVDHARLQIAYTEPKRIIDNFKLITLS